MKVGVFSTQPYDREPLLAANAGHGHELVVRAGTDGLGAATDQRNVALLNADEGAAILQNLPSGKAATSL
mgnify:CR=1 FL=1